MADRWFLTDGGGLLYGDGEGGSTPYGVVCWGDAHDDDRRHALRQLGDLATEALRSDIRTAATQLLDRWDRERASLQRCIDVGHGLTEYGETRRLALDDLADEAEALRSAIGAAP